MSDRPGGSTVYIHMEHTCLTDQETHNMSDRPRDTQHVSQTTRHTTCLTDQETALCIYTHTDHPACQEQCGVTGDCTYTQTPGRLSSGTLLKVLDVITMPTARRRSVLEQTTSRRFLDGAEQQEN